MRYLCFFLVFSFGCDNVKETSQKKEKPKVVSTTSDALEFCTCLQNTTKTNEIDACISKHNKNSLKYKDKEAEKYNKAITKCIQPIIASEYKEGCDCMKVAMSKESLEEGKKVEVECKKQNDIMNRKYIREIDQKMLKTEGVKCSMELLGIK